MAQRLEIDDLSINEPVETRLPQSLVASTAASENRCGTAAEVAAFKDMTSCRLEPIDPRLTSDLSEASSVGTLKRMRAWIGRRHRPDADPSGSSV